MGNSRDEHEKMMLRRGATVLATGAVAMLVGGSVAGAQPVSTTFIPTVGVPQPSAISSNSPATALYVYAVLTAATDSTEPGRTKFPGTGDIPVDLTVHWETTRPVPGATRTVVTSSPGSRPAQAS